jgi:hypothetical protein
MTENTTLVFPRGNLTTCFSVITANGNREQVPSQTVIRLPLARAAGDQVVVFSQEILDGSSPAAPFSVVGEILHLPKGITVKPSRRLWGCQYPLFSRKGTTSAVCTAIPRGGDHYTDFSQEITTRTSSLPPDTNGQASVFTSRKGSGGCLLARWFPSTLTEARL